MKKLMIIAVIVSAMLMPAQVFANNGRNGRDARKGANKVQVDRGRAESGVKVLKRNNKPAPAPVAKHKPAPVVHRHKPAPVVHHHKPAPVVHHHRPAPVVHHHCSHVPVVHHHHCNPVPVVHHHHCGNGVVEAAAVAVGVVGLISALAGN